MSSQPQDSRPFVVNLPPPAENGSSSRGHPTTPPQPPPQQSDEEITLAEVIYLVLFACVWIVLGSLIYFCILVISLATLPLLLVSLLIMRLFQLIRYGHEYKKVTKFKHVIRGWLYIDVAVVLLALGIFYPIAKYVPSLNQLMLLNLPITNWIVVITIVCGFYLISYFIYSLTHLLTRVLNVRSLNVAQAFSEIIDGLLFWWAKHEVTNRVPAFKNHEILGLPTRRWIRASIILVIGYNFITLFTHIAVLALQRACKREKQDSEAAHNSFWHTVIGNHFHKRYVVYFADGMKLSISFIMSSFLLLFTWILYFGSHLDMKIDLAQSTWEYGLWTFISLLICSFFWLIKTFVLLAWEVHTVYHRLEPKIKSTSEQLYFLGILGCDNENDILGLRHTIVEARGEAETTSKINKTSKDGFKCLKKWIRLLTFISWFQSLPKKAKKKAKKKLNFEMRERIKNDLLIYEDHWNPTIDDLQRASQYFLKAKRFLLKENYKSDILKKCNLKNIDEDKRAKLQDIISHHKESNIQPGRILKKMLSKTASQIQRGPLKAITKGEDEQKDKAQNSKSDSGKHINDFDHFVTSKKLLNMTEPSAKIQFTDIQAWVEKAHRQCVFLANTISSAEEVVGVLDKIISWLLIGVIFIMWLLLTELATTKVLVLIASPLLAATFIFGEACRTLFEGILFVYVVHPFDVGDICVIDEKMLEVAAICIWTTTFKKVDKHGTQEEVIYPNIELAKKVINNQKTKFDWTDCVEFNLGDINMSNIKNQEDFRKIIKNLLEEEKVDSKSSYDYDLTISIVEENSIKLIAHLTYIEADKNKGWTYTECLRQKDKLHADFCLFMKHVISKFKTKQNPQFDKPCSSTRDESVSKSSREIQETERSP